MSPWAGSTGSSPGSTTSARATSRCGAFARATCGHSSPTRSPTRRSPGARRRFFSPRSTGGTRGSIRRVATATSSGTPGPCSRTSWRWAVRSGWRRVSTRASSTPPSAARSAWTPSVKPSWNWWRSGPRGRPPRPSPRSRTAAIRTCRSRHPKSIPPAPRDPRGLDARYPRRCSRLARSRAGARGARIGERGRGGRPPSPRRASGAARGIRARPRGDDPAAGVDAAVQSRVLERGGARDRALGRDPPDRRRRPRGARGPLSDRQRGRGSHVGGVLVPPGGARARALGGGPLSERIGVPLPRAAPRRRRRGGDLLPRAAPAHPPRARQPRLPPRQPRGRHCRRPRLPRRLRRGAWRLRAHLLRPSRRRVLLVARRGPGRHLRRGTRTRGRKRTCYHRNDTEPSKEAVRMKKYQLMAPGPTPVPSEVLLAMAKPMIHHRTPQYEALFTEVRAGLKRIFQTAADVLPLACSGTGAMEAAVVNTLSAREAGAVVPGGEVGDRLGEICKAYGVTVVELAAPLGLSGPPPRGAETLRAHPGVRAVLTQHSESSTGVLHDVR